MTAFHGKPSNLQSFLTRTTPVVQAYPLEKTSMQDLNSSWEQIFHEKEYFTLGELWENYTEWSAYGVGVPILLDNCKSVVQYYVPYLSAIQIYTNKSHATSRNVIEESESESVSDDSESEKLSRSWDGVSENSDQNGSSSPRDRLGQLYLQYIEYASPYGRMPLMDKVNELAQIYPGLTSFKSMVISPASWMSVAWYPIYQIPTCRNVKDLSTCFLTYHTISASFQDNHNAATEDTTKDTFGTTDLNLREDSNYLYISPFALATYKMQGSLWRNPKAADDVEMISSLHIAAYSWLKQLGVDHHDFDFFTTH